MKTQNKKSFSARINTTEYQEMQDNADSLDIPLAQYGRQVIQRELKTKVVFTKIEQSKKIP